ncbi:kinase-like domain-containing protein [Mortierella sp. GBAus27b]|nr:hypothetical protein BGX31_008865 [Mortierella sp. GBA43]KAI8352787.1 kinase-like domain-containing protein [Mortierella sp. GBAus27b]
MYILRTIDTLHEHPFTGDKIIKARVFSFDPVSLPDEPIWSPHSNGVATPLGGNQTPGQADITHVGHTGDDADGGHGRAREPSQGFPRFAAVKHLNNHKLVRQPSRDDSHWDDDNDDRSSNRDPDNDLRHARNGLEEWQRRRWPLMGETRASGKIEFGLSAKREIRALRAAQGHPNIIPFLGFTTPPKPNPFKTPKKHQDELSATPLPLGGSLSLSHKESNNGKAEDLGESLLGPPLGRSLFQDQDSHPERSPSSVSAALQALFPAAPISGFGSDSESDRGAPYDSDSDDDMDVYSANMNPSTMTAQQWDWVFSRQPWMGGIIFPYIPLRLLDLIDIGWIAKRPLMAEMCMRQILEGLAWLHDDIGLIHRDISPTNIVVTVGRSIKGNEGFEGEDIRGFVQCMISDFGCATFHRPAANVEAPEKHSSLPNEAKLEDAEDLSHQFGDPSSSLEQRLTFEVGTRAYRAPELLFSSGDYTNAVDIWSAGVIFAEMYLGKPLFTADTDITQICAIVKVLGAITEQSWPEYPSMPDAGKLLFNVKDTTPLSQILWKQTTPTPSSGGGPGSDGAGESSSDATSSSAPATLISQPAFELIESMIAYSGAGRPSAKAALDFRDRYLMRTKNLEAQWFATSPTQHPQTSSTSVDPNNQRHDEATNEFSQQCIFLEREVLTEVRELRKRTANSAPAGRLDDDDYYHRQYDWSDSDAGTNDYDGDGDYDDGNASPIPA